MLNVTKMAERLKTETAWQKTPVDLEQSDYEEMIVNGLRRMYIDTGRATEYDSALLITNEENGDVVYNLDSDLPIDEEEYIFIAAKINFYRQVANDVNNIVGYTTNALSVTNADKPYANLKDTIEKLDNERRILHYKMVRYVML